MKYIDLFEFQTNPRFFHNYSQLFYDKGKNTVFSVKCWTNFTHMQKEESRHRTCILHVNYLKFDHRPECKPKKL